MKKLALATTLATLFVGTAQAGFLYEEVTGGDLDTATNANSEFEFTAGSNLIKGTGSNAKDEPVDLDGFLFSLDVGLSLDKVIFRAYNFQVSTNTTDLSALWYLKEGSYSGAALSEDGLGNILMTQDQEFFDKNLPLGAGTYAFDPVSLKRVGDGGTWNYEVEFFVSNVNNVPEPTTLAILGLGLAGLAASRQKKKLS